MFETIALFVVLAVVVGIASGFLAGFFGVGGGVVLVPVFLSLFHWLSPGASSVMKEAVGTALFLVIPAGIAAVRRQSHLGNIDAQQGLRWAIYVAVGALLGTVVSHYVHGGVLKIIFLFYLVFCLLLLLLVKERKDGLDKSPQGLFARTMPGIIGCVSVLLGIGGGTLATPILRLYGSSMKRALGFASATTVSVGLIGAVGMMIAGWGVPGRVPYSIGYVSIIASVLIGPFMFWASPKGVSVAHQLPKGTLRVLYILFLTTIFGYMLWQSVAFH